MEMEQGKDDWGNSRSSPCGYNCQTVHFSRCHLLENCQIPDKGDLLVGLVVGAGGDMAV